MARARTPDNRSDNNFVALIVIVVVVVAVFVLTKWVFALVWLALKTFSLLAIAVLLITFVVRKKARR